MRFSGFAFVLFRCLLVPAIVGTVWLYLYPAFSDCNFPAPPTRGYHDSTVGTPFHSASGRIAPFRLLALGDPQLEGDTSLPDPNAPTFASLARWRDLALNAGFSSSLQQFRSIAQDVLTLELPTLLHSWRKRLDLWGNDLYLAHIYRTVSWWAQPTHTVVLGDLLGSQWIGDDEFKRRSDRFWRIVFKDGERVPDVITNNNGAVEMLGQDWNWTKRVISVAGNHDIGYAGDIDEDRITRFEGSFGKVNWAMRFAMADSIQQPSQLAESPADFVASSRPELRVIILNSMNLDDPVKDQRLRDQSRDFVLHELHQNANTYSNLTATVLLTHIPFHKEAGVCVDGTFFDYFENGGIKEQNHLTEMSSHFILDGMVKSAGDTIVLNGHDHEGCDTYHYRAASPSGADDNESAPDQRTWRAKRWQALNTETSDASYNGIREITVRSMMGSYGGNAGLLSAWFDIECGRWKFEYKSCMLGVQHIWWAVHILDIIVVGLGVGSAVISAMRGTALPASDSLATSDGKLKKS